MKRKTNGTRLIPPIPDEIHDPPPAYRSFYFHPPPPVHHPKISDPPEYNRPPQLVINDFPYTHFDRTSMLKGHVFPNYENMIRIIWFCIVLTANTCSLHENQHYHVWSSMVYVKHAMTLTLLLALFAIVFTLYDIKTISIFIVILH